MVKKEVEEKVNYKGQEFAIDVLDIE